MWTQRNLSALACYLNHCYLEKGSWVLGPSSSPAVCLSGAACAHDISIGFKMWFPFTNHRYFVHMLCWLLTELLHIFILVSSATSVTPRFPQRSQSQKRKVWTLQPRASEPAAAVRYILEGQTWTWDWVTPLLVASSAFCQYNLWLHGTTPADREHLQNFSLCYVKDLSTVGWQCSCCNISGV